MSGMNGDSSSSSGSDSDTSDSSSSSSGMSGMSGMGSDSSSSSESASPTLDSSSSSAGMSGMSGMGSDSSSSSSASAEAPSRSAVPNTLLSSELSSFFGELDEASHLVTDLLTQLRKLMGKGPGSAEGGTDSSVPSSTSTPIDSDIANNGLAYDGALNPTGARRKLRRRESGIPVSTAAVTFGAGMGTQDLNDALDPHGLFTMGAAHPVSKTHLD
jgi:hypothetical protein